MVLAGYPVSSMSSRDAATNGSSFGSSRPAGSSRENRSDCRPILMHEQDAQVGGDRQRDDIVRLSDGVVGLNRRLFRKLNIARDDLDPGRYRIAHVYQRSAVKGCPSRQADGSVICSAYSETLEFDKGWVDRA